MSLILISIALVFVAALMGIWIAVRWLSGSWEVLNDKQGQELVQGKKRRINRKQLASRRDKRGRFKRIWRW